MGKHEGDTIWGLFATLLLLIVVVLFAAFTDSSGPEPIPLPTAPPTTMEETP